MAHLPVEVVEILFKYLNSLEDRKAASLVCQQWYRAYLNPCFRTSEVVSFTIDKQIKLFTEMENDHRQFVHYTMSNVDITPESLPFWRNHGKYIKTLSFFRCCVQEQVFIKALQYCTALEKLAVQDCKDLLMSGLLLETEEDRGKLRAAWRYLKILDLSYNRYLSDALLIKVLALCPGVNTLILTGCQLSYHNGMFRKFYPEGFQNPSESVTTFQMIMRYIKSNSRRIKNLSLSETLLDSTSLHKLAQIENMDLLVLQLRSCVQISNHGLIQMCSSGNVNTLTELDIGLCPRITDTSLIILCSSLRQLRRLSLHGCRAITDLGLANIWQLDKLESLNLSDCDGLQGAGILKGLCYKTNYNLRELQLCYLSSITEAIVIGIVEGMPNLRSLDLSHCYNGVTDKSLQHVFRLGSRLRRLSLAQCDQVTDSGLTGMGVSKLPVAPSIAHLLRLPLGSRHELEILRDAKEKEEVRELSETELLASDKSGVSLSTIQGLQYLDISGCYRITDASLKYAFRLIELKKLDMSHCQRITQEGLRHLTSHCTAIEDLNLDMCDGIDDDGVQVAVSYLPRLKHLTIGSEKVTNEVALHFANYGHRLIDLDLSHCTNVTAESVSHLSNILPFLQNLHNPEIVAPVVRAPRPPPPPPPNCCCS